MNRNNWLNMLWMQALWFGAVIGAAREQLWLAPVVMIGFAFWELRPGRRVYGDFQLMLVAVLIGLILDTTWVRLGWLEFAAGWVFSERAPLWILLLWAGLALTLNHSLAWLQSRLVLAAVLGGVSSPLSYLGGGAFGGGGYCYRIRGLVYRVGFKLGGCFAAITVAGESFQTP